MNPHKPNIIFILIDDMGWRDLSVYGSTFYETPVLDRLAAEGMRFTDAYAACPVCSPTRASILSGKYPATVGVTNFISHSGAHPSRGKLIDVPYTDHLPLENKTLATALKDGGYRTWHIGKWHLGLEPYWPDKQGFDVNIGGCEWGAPAHGYFSPYNHPNLADGPEGEYLTDRLTDDAIRLIRTESDKPFFLNMWYYAVHTPIQAPADLVEKYTKKAATLGLDKIQPFEEGDHFPCEHTKANRITRRRLQSDPAYAAMVERLDWNIGRLVSALEETGALDDTVIMFTSDNGGLATAEGSPTCNAPLAEGKGWMYEGGTREPLIVRWPGHVAPGSVCGEPVTSPDFYPTLLAAAGLPQRPEQHVDGVNVLPLLESDASFRRGPIYWHYPHYGNQGGTPGSSVRDGKYKLIEFFEDGRLELYDLEADISEERNLAAELPDVRNRLYGLLKEWQQKVEAKIPQPNPDWRN